LGREIKFRFYSNITKKMYNDMSLIGLVYSNDSNPCMYNADRITKEPGETRCQYLNDGHLMQYTGLKDKNDKEVYEGDILTRTESEFYPDYFKIEWCEERGGFMLTYQPCGEVYDLAEFWPDSVVVGNIYENPNLVKE